MTEKEYVMLSCADLEKYKAAILCSPEYVVSITKRK